jgi:hypothetical protein
LPRIARISTNFLIYYHLSVTLSEVEGLLW